MALAVGVGMMQCGRAEDRTSWDDDLVVQQERYRRLGLDFEEARAREDAACIIRSKRMEEVIIAGGRRRAADGTFATGPPCDYDAVIMGAKTFIAGVAKATDRAMLYGGWRHADEERKLRLFLDWFEEALTAGGEVVAAGDEQPLISVGKPWQPAAVEHTGKRYVATGWVKITGAKGAPRFELRQCGITEELSFEGCSVLDAFGGE